MHHLKHLAAFGIGGGLNKNIVWRDADAEARRIDVWQENLCDNAAVIDTHSDVGTDNQFRFRSQPVFYLKAMCRSALQELVVGSLFDAVLDFGNTAVDAVDFL